MRSAGPEDEATAAEGGPTAAGGEGAKLTREGLPVEDEEHRDMDVTGRNARRPSLPSPDELAARMYARMAMEEQEPPSPADAPTRSFARGLTALSAEGRTLGQDFGEALKSPTFPGDPTPGTPDTSTAARQQADDSDTPSVTMDEDSDSDPPSRLRAPPSEDEAETRHSATARGLFESPATVFR
ncbi:hypothetical protein KVR01_004573 [Diaporthe batatas]|uniref:uncharacterized protein n=1 Tax=Diaporthe batatas TaxID=748121 RepID=UPI001D0549CA|nr:uncharacterized protein KVR01_004573 [Diaporthe batatas]KAG8166021.1 hypothetical protein KVR01_004573 [Diaporthe batatas]